MKLRTRHIILIVAAALILISFFFFVLAHKTYSSLVNVGLMAATVSMIIIWLKDTWRMKIMWTVIALLFAVVQQVTEASSIRQSTKWMIHSNEEMLLDVSLALVSKPGDILLLKSDNQHDATLFTDQEWKKISDLFEKTDIKLISKDDSRIYYEVYGMLDSRVGFSCSYTALSTDFGTGMKTNILQWNY